MNFTPRDRAVIKCDMLLTALVKMEMGRDDEQTEAKSMLTNLCEEWENTSPGPDEKDKLFTEIFRRCIQIIDLSKRDY